MEGGMNVAMIVGAGRGSRMSGTTPKQYRSLGGMPIIRRTMTAFLRHPEISHVQVVIHPDDRNLYFDTIADLDLPPPVIGGATRQDSVRLGLESMVELSPSKVIIHDAVRPFVDQDTISAVIGALDEVPAAIAGVPVTDTLKRCKQGIVGDTVDRTDVWRALTPQGFRYDSILAAHRAAHLRDPNHLNLTDDAAVAEEAGIEIAMVRGNEENFKITTEHDLVRAQMILNMGRLEHHVGYGFDAHPFGPGDHVMLCGIPVPHEAGIARQQNMDVPLNALTDALLGTFGTVSNEDHFKPDLPRWAGGSSELFVRRAVSLVAMKGGQILNVDVTIICESPKIGPHRSSMVPRLASLLNVSEDRVSVKATTTEGLGFAGRREGIATQAMATVQYPAL
jgi:2-C-methyl-D-erythritol 4-phosphate cytidylyltransferase / 2-C-methyl-D-erythritol 2,4-cyclodiphosphate synthase